MQSGSNVLDVNNMEAFPTFGLGVKAIVTLQFDPAGPTQIHLELDPIGSACVTGDHLDLAVLILLAPITGQRVVPSHMLPLIP